MSDREPFVSIIMAAYNSAAFIGEAIESILKQSWQNWELIIVDDGSTDDTSAIVRSFANDRIRLLQNDTNRSNHYSRNRALEHAKGAYIAIMDSDDRAVPGRLEKQLSFLRSHPDVALVGGAIRKFGRGEEEREFYPSDPEYIRSWLFFKNCIAQPAVMFRRELLDEGLFRYREDWPQGCTDYALWYELADNEIKLSNMPEVLLYYRVSEGQQSATRLHIREQNLKEFFAARLKDKFSIELSGEELELVFRFTRTRIRTDKTAFKVLEGFFTRLRQVNKRQKRYSVRYFHAVLWFFYLRLGKYYYLEYKKQPLSFAVYMTGVVRHIGLRSLLVFLKEDRRRWL